MSAAVQSFLNEFVAWASNHDKVIAVLLVGSYARGQAHEGSDVDLTVLATDPAPFISNPAWAERFGSVERQQVECYGKLTSLRVFYAGGLEVEYGFAGKDWAAVPLDEGTRQVLIGGFRILFERSRLGLPAVNS